MALVVAALVLENGVWLMSIVCVAIYCFAEQVRTAPCDWRDFDGSTRMVPIIAWVFRVNDAQLTPFCCIFLAREREIARSDWFSNTVVDSPLHVR